MRKLIKEEIIMDHPTIAFAHLNAISAPRRRAERAGRGFWARLFGL